MKIYKNESQINLNKNVRWIVTNQIDRWTFINLQAFWYWRVSNRRHKIGVNNWYGKGKNRATKEPWEFSDY